MNLEDYPIEELERALEVAKEMRKQNQDKYNFHCVCGAMRNFNWLNLGEELLYVDLRVKKGNHTFTRTIRRPK